MLRGIRTHNDPILKRVCEPVERGEDLSFLNDLRDTCRGRSDAVGLSAPQIGVAKRAVFIWHRRNGGESLMMVNPQIVGRSGSSSIESEGCLSYPGTFTPVRRSIGVEVTYTDPASWQERRRYFTGFQARVVQHEIDHLDGICLVGDAWREAKEVQPVESIAS